MDKCSKVGLGILALALSCAPAMAQGGPQDPPAGQPGGSGEMGGPGGPMGPDGSGFGRRHGGWGRDGGEHRGFAGGRRDFSLSRLLSDPDVRQQVGVSDDQLAKIRQQESDYRKTEIRDRADLEVKRVDLHTMLESDKPDRAAIDSKLAEISASQLALEKSKVKFRLDMRNAITPEQRTKLREVMRQRWARGGDSGWQRGPRGGRHGGQRGPGPGPSPAPGAAPGSSSSPQGEGASGQ